MEEMNPLEYLTSLLQIYNYKDTTGIIFFNNGLALKIPAFFDYYQEQWSMYKKITTTGTYSEINEFLQEVDGGVISNGAITISLPDIVAMIKENEAPFEDILNPETPND